MRLWCMQGSTLSDNVRNRHRAIARGDIFHENSDLRPVCNTPLEITKRRMASPTFCCHLHCYYTLNISKAMLLISTLIVILQ